MKTEERQPRPGERSPGEHTPEERAAHRWEDCPECKAGTPVSHCGSRYCRSGSLASGGHRAHCTCDTCF